MKDYIVKDEWKIIEDKYRPEYNQITESLLSLGNGKMGQRANFEEAFSGETLQGSYIAGVYYPDKTRVGWWKNGYPEYFAKVLNSCNWIGIDVMIDGERLDLAKVKEIHHFHRSLDMKSGLLQRSMIVTLQKGAKIEINSKRFTSMANDELGVISYSIKSHGFNGEIKVSSYLDFDVLNTDSNYDEKFWISNESKADNSGNYVAATTKKTDYHVGVAMENRLTLNGTIQTEKAFHSKNDKCSNSYSITVVNEDEILLTKYVGVASSMYYESDTVKTTAITTAREASKSDFDTHRKAHASAWADIWDMCDVKIVGDVSAQQGIRFNIFQLYQTYTGQDARLNIGPKGFTGEKYGGSTYWDTEAYCLPFYLSTADQNVAKNLLIYRHKHLQKAIENAENLGFSDGAALYPMVTMTGEECHNEWEITFEEIHRNGAIAYAIYDYINYTGDDSYLADYGVEVLVSIARFWAQRVNWSEARSKFVMLGVTGPNEYENNVNNNWYTNYIASWCLKYAQEALDHVYTANLSRYNEIIKSLNFSSKESAKWIHIRENMYFPKDDNLGIFLQQDNYLDKEQILVDDLPEADRPLNQKWSWDRILRSCFIKQADVLQGLYFFEDEFDKETHKTNYLFYEPRTVHESSLSPCVHGILATKLGMHDKAYEMYLRTSRLDLDDYNNDTEDGCHITSMAGTWLAIVKGFGGQRVRDNKLSFSPSLPKQWDRLSFKIKYRQNLLEVIMSQEETTIRNHEGPEIELVLNDTERSVSNGSSISILNSETVIL